MPKGKAKVVDTDVMIMDHQIQSKLNKLKEDKHVRDLFDDELDDAKGPPMPKMTMSAMKKACKKPRTKKAPVIDLERVTVDQYQYKEYLESVKKIVPTAVNKATFNDDGYKDRLQKSKDLTHAADKLMGFAIQSDYIGALATILGISLEHYMEKGAEAPNLVGKFKGMIGGGPKSVPPGVDVPSTPALHDLIDGETTQA